MRTAMAKIESWSRYVRVLIGVWLLIHGSAAQGNRLRSQWCHGNVCYRMYQFNETLGDSWQTANEQCEVHGLHLTAVWDQTVQDALNSAPPLNENGSVQAWLAGRRDDDPRVMWLNNEPYNGTLLSDGYNCGYMQDMRISLIRCLYSSWCICEQNYVRGDCPFDSVPYRDKCVWVIRDRITWYQCWMNCNQGGGVVASLVEEIPDLMASLQSTGVYTNLGFWVGLRRRPWSWISGTGQSTSTRYPMEYYNFVGYSRYNCVTINMTSSRKWISLECHLKLPFFICDDDTATRGTSRTSVTPGGMPGSTEDTATQDKSKTSVNPVVMPRSTEVTTGGQGFVLTTGALAGIAVGGLVLLIAIIVTSVILCQRRQRETRSQNNTTGLAVAACSPVQYYVNADAVALNEARYESIGEGPICLRPPGRGRK